MKRKTSVDAYHSILSDGTVGRLQKIVYTHLWGNGPLTTRQLQKGIKQYARDVGIVSARLTELHLRGLVEDVGTTVCKTTGKTVILWDVTDQMPIKLEKPKKFECPHCNGKGWTKEQQMKMF